MDSAIALLARARAADPGFFPAQHEYIQLRWNRGEFFTIRREYATPDPRGATVGECLALATAAFPTMVSLSLVPPKAEPFARLVALERRGDPSGCAATYVVALTAWAWPRDGPLDVMAVTYARRATTSAPEVLNNWTTLAELLDLGRRPRDAVASIRAGLRHMPHLLPRAQLYQSLVDVLTRAGDSAAARRLSAALSAAVARDGRAAFRSQMFGNTGAGARRIAAAAGSWEWRLNGLWNMSGVSLDRGDLLRAMLFLDSAVALADSVGSPLARLRSLRVRGRAEVKLGRFRAAERDLRDALAAGVEAPDEYFLAETWHNLAHLYEGEGRWGEAAAAVDRFVGLTQPMRWDDLRMMSLHDAGVIRWKAGWHAAANVDFRAMVRVVDEQHRNHYWAGEFFEHTGDLARALTAYRASTHEGEAWPAQGRAGLARVYEALGKDDSAEAAAAAHDSLVAQWTPVDAPLLPAFLARHGRPADAVSLDRRWVARQLGDGNVEGAAIAGVQLAELLLALEHPDSAAMEAERAERLAASLHLTDELVQAGTLRGRALVALGARDSGLTVLARTAALASRHSTATSTFVTELALGNALAAAGRPTEALAAFNRAARVVEVVTTQLVEDLDRAGYRGRHLEPFDAALVTLLGQPETAARTDAVLLWSQRRKAAALALATGGVEGATGSPRRSRAEIEARLGPYDAVVDYTVTPARVAAIVVTDHGASVVPLAITADSLAAWVRRLRRPLTSTFAGRIDLARAPFDMPLAHRLYQLLVQPLEPLLAGRNHLAIAPDGALQALPFAALVTDLPPAAAGYARARYLVDRFEVHYVPSVQFLSTGEHPLPPGARVVAVTIGAPGGDREVALVRAAFPEGRVHVIAGAAATESAVRAVHGGDVLHFAVHAVADGSDPLASHLRLARDSGDDGYLHLNEIARARWDASLVVLSACETLEGPLYSGEGMVGLARAFLAGGAGTVVATQWPVGATSADLMGAFYHQLAAGDTPAAALRSAQLFLRRAPVTSHPFYWAGYVTVEGR